MEHDFTRQQKVRTIWLGGIAFAVIVIAMLTSIISNV